MWPIQKKRYYVATIKEKIVDEKTKNNGRSKKEEYARKYQSLWPNKSSVKLKKGKKEITQGHDIESKE